MILTLLGHDYKYAVEQIMLMLFPGERPVYRTPEDAPAAPGVLSAEVRLTRGATYAAAYTRLVSDGRVFKGSARVRSSLLTDKLATDRLLQKIIKRSFYKAAVSATGAEPPWGALTGIRPGKIASGLLESGFSDRRVLTVLKNDYYVSPRRAALTLDTAKASLAVRRALHNRDAALYIGIPFCPTRCHYCSFVSHSVEKSGKLIDPFLDALALEIDALSSVVKALGLSVVSVYMGGGTPTTLSPEQLRALMERLGSAFDLSRVREYTVEAGRPDTITAEKLDAIKRSGADRISINPQSMSDSVLHAIGRRHSAGDVEDAVALARAAGFKHLNMDLIAGLPGDHPEGFSASLEKVLSLGPENITVHTLSLKKGTKITLEETPVPDGEAVSAMLDAAESRLRANGYLPYYLYRQKFMSGGFENVGWCQKGHESVYNILIMEELATVLALGGGGVTKLVNSSTGRIERIFNLKYPYEYISHIDKVLQKKALISEFYSG
jgi:oxygen-independent coproporphyrinogen-3 oxidase